MGTAYRNHASGSNFGNLYGLAYKHTNNGTSGAMGSGHQMVWCDNGNPRGAIGYSYVWHRFGMKIGDSANIAWGNYPHIQFGKYAAISSIDTDDVILLCTNAYKASNGDWKVMLTGNSQPRPTQIKMENGIVDFYCAPTQNSSVDIGSARWTQRQNYGYSMYYNYFRPIRDNYSDLGTSSRRWDDVYATNGTIQLSDAREKTVIETDDLVIKAIDSIDIATYKWNSAIEKKGEDEARIHYGVIAQDVKQAFEDQGLVAEKYAILCYNEWEDEYDKEGNLITEAGNRYGVRYDQLHALKCASLDKKIKELEKRIEQLENS
jgi:hypothetical protein